MILCNPNAGKGNARLHARRLEEEFASQGINNCIIHCSRDVHSMSRFLAANRSVEFTLAVIIGGDGTVGPFVDAMLKNNLYIPILAYGKGTANDFASHFKTNTNPKRAVEIIKKGKLNEVDTLQILGEQGADLPSPRTAINVVGGGAFTSGATHYRRTYKKHLGRYAYLIKAGLIAPFSKCQKLCFTIDETTFYEDAIMFFIVNTKSVGGLRRAGSVAQPHDGVLDLICVKSCGIYGKVMVALSAVFGRLDKCRYVTYKQGANFSIEPVGTPGRNFQKTDSDGSPLGDYPLRASVGKKISVVVR